MWQHLSHFCSCHRIYWRTHSLLLDSSLWKTGHPGSRNDYENRRLQNLHSGTLHPSWCLESLSRGACAITLIHVLSCVIAHSHTLVLCPLPEGKPGLQGFSLLAVHCRELIRSQNRICLNALVSGKWQPLFWTLKMTTWELSRDLLGSLYWALLLWQLYVYTYF